MRIQDLTGMKFNNLTVLSYHGREGKRKRAVWLCKCSCGNETVVRGENLKSNAVKSCGCLRHKSPPNKTHGLRNDRLYGVWQNMKNRCYNKKVNAYKYYGARGIKVCEEWKNDFSAFYNWCTKNGLEKGLKLDRIDNDGDYSPSNCRAVVKYKNLSNKGKYKNNTSGHVGVRLHQGRKYIACISYCGETKYLGSFDNIKEAVMFRNMYIIAHRIPKSIDLTY